MAARRYSIRLRNTGAARGEPLSTSSCTLASVLSRKCGWICAVSRPRRVSAACRCRVSRSSASCSARPRARSLDRARAARESAHDHGDGRHEEIAAHMAARTEEGRQVAPEGEHLHDEGRHESRGRDGDHLRQPARTRPARQAPAAVKAKSSTMATNRASPTISTNGFLNSGRTRTATTRATSTTWTSWRRLGSARCAGGCRRWRDRRGTTRTTCGRR